MDKKELIEETGKMIEEKLGKEGIEYMFAATAEGVGTYLKHSDIKSEILKQIVTLATKLCPSDK